MRNKGFSPVIVLLLVALFGIGALLFQSNRKVEPPQFTDNDPENIVLAVKNYFNSATNYKFEDVEGGGVFWEKGEWQISDLEASSIKHTSLQKDVNGHPDKAPYRRELYEAVASIMVNNGFTEVESKEPEVYYQNTWLNRWGVFDKERTRCIFYSFATGRSFSFDCSNKLEERLEEQLPYLQALNAVDIAATSISYIERAGDFVRVGHDASYSIGRWENGDFVKIWGPSQDTVWCKAMRENNVPTSLYGTCYDEDVGKEYDVETGEYLRY